MTIPKQRRTFLRDIQSFVITTILGGLVVVLPITVFVFVIRLLFNLIIGLIRPLSSLFGFSDSINEWLINILVLAAILLLFFLIGLAVRTEIGKKLFRRMEEQWLAPLPFYGVIRETVQQLFSRDRMPFSQVVLVDPYGSGMLMTGFVTDELPNGFYTVFVPTAPNPTNGFIFHVKPDQLHFVDTKSEEALRTVISLGIGSRRMFEALERNKAPKDPSV